MVCVHMYACVRVHQCEVWWIDVNEFRANITASGEPIQRCYSCNSKEQLFLLVKVLFLFQMWCGYKLIPLYNFAFQVNYKMF